jgi:hypothetical protein
MPARRVRNQAGGDDAVACAARHGMLVLYGTVRAGLAYYTVINRESREVHDGETARSHDGPVDR